jgi:hypothetical protein
MSETSTSPVDYLARRSFTLLLLVLFEKKLYDFAWFISFIVQDIIH